MRRLVPHVPGFVSTPSQFIKTATRAVRSYPLSTTTKVEALRCELTDEAKMGLKKEGVKSIVFVDTPFLTGRDDIDAQKEIRKWINQTK